MICIRVPYVSNDEEIIEQPLAFKRTLAAERDHALAFADFARKQNFRLVVLAARGTSDNAALYGSLLFEFLVSGFHFRHPWLSNWRPVASSLPGNTPPNNTRQRRINGHTGIEQRRQRQRKDVRNRNTQVEYERQVDKRSHCASQ